MPYRRSGLSRFRRRFFRRGRTFRAGRKYFKRSVKRVVFNIAEKKYFDYVFNAKDMTLWGAGTSAWNNVNASTYLTNDFSQQGSLIGCIQQGNSVNTRIGNRIHVKYIQLAIMFLQNNNTAAGTQASAASNAYGMFCRYMLFNDTQPNTGSLPIGIFIDNGTTIGSVGSGVSPVPFTGARSMAFRDFNTLRSLRVMLDMQHQSFNTASATAAGNVASSTGVKVLQHFVPVNKDFTFNAVAAAQDMKAAHAVMKDNDIIFFVTPSDNACCQCFVQVRVCYTDI